MKRVLIGAFALSMMFVGSASALPLVHLSIGHHHHHGCSWDHHHHHHHCW
ncbi:MAG TPA: hypothetical protein VGL58_15745 [Caulobacteraceae bacterium]